MADKQHWANIKLMGGSQVVDASGAVVSLTSDQRLAISSAYGGSPTQANPLVTKDQMTSDIAVVSTNLGNQISALSSGIRWRDPVDTVSATPPTATPAVGARYLNTTDDKIYTCSVLNEWGSGEVPSANWTVFARDTDEEWTYDEEGTAWVMRSSGAIPNATTSVSGKVMLAADKEVSATKVVVSNDSRLAFLKGSYSTTLASPTGTVTVTHNLGSTKLFVQAWVGGEEADVQIARTVADASNQLDITVNGAPASVELVIIALP